jgi:hypothetical protein
MEEEGEWKMRPSRRSARVDCDLALGATSVGSDVMTQSDSGSGSRRRGVVPKTAPSLRVERSRRERCSGSRVLLVGGGAAKSSTMVVVAVEDIARWA